MNTFLKFKFDIQQEKSQSIIKENYYYAGTCRMIERNIENFDIDNYEQWYNFVKEYKAYFLSDKLNNLIIKLEQDINNIIRKEKLNKICSKSEIE